MAVDAELQNAINSAAEEISGKSVEEITRRTPPAENQENQPEDNQEETSEETNEIPGEDELTEVEIAEARLVYKKLKDPTEGTALVAALAQRAGLLNDRPLETKTEVKEAKKDIQKIFEEALGPQYKFLAPNLGKALDEILQQERIERQSELSEIHVNQALQIVDKTLNQLRKETNGQLTLAVENHMASLMDEYPLAPNGNPDKYIRDMYALATSGKQKAVVSKKISDGIRRNANNVADRLGNRNGQPGAETLPGKKMNLTESIRWAQQQLEKKNK